ncbi:GNAT family N-acetyltransferase [Chelatococcus sp. GCM10030263]|uniref:GNAT family N-acetyltransferase n=1 Tax=Chelatococcus sp. GCM10030263 TaxID=3273387 RepID=UPI00360E77E2
MSDIFLSVIERGPARPLSRFRREPIQLVEPSPAALPLADGAFTVEQRPLRAMAELEAAWTDLASRVLEPNPFYEYAFAAGGGQHLPEGRHVTAVLVWTGNGVTRRLVGFFPVLLPRHSWLAAPARLWRPSLVPLGVPLVDREQAAGVVGAFLDHLTRRGTRAAGVLFPVVAEEDAFAATLTEVARARQFAMRHFARHKRAVLRASADAGFISLRSARKVKELRRQLRRLGEIGQVSFTHARQPQAVREAVEYFLALEASGWKAAAGTALLQQPGAAAFVRTMTRRLAREGRCEVHLLRLDERPIAAGIVLRSGSKAFFWKIAYDEDFARFSPGVQLTVALTDAQLADGSVSCTDSCAVANHPMIDHLWRDRLPVADILVATGSEQSIATRLLIARETLQRQLRDFGKKLYYRFKAQPKKQAG